MQDKMQEILGMLNAYRQGWVEYDATHVAQLRKEYAILASLTN